MRPNIILTTLLGMLLLFVGCTESNFLAPEEEQEPAMDKTVQTAPAAVPMAAMEAATNVALNATVTLHGAPFFTDGWGGGITVDPATIVDGVFFPRETQWDQGPVWWDSGDDQERYITMDLGGTFVIESLVVQADDNDAYILYYWDLGDAQWKILWNVPNYDALGWGMQTRPNPADDTERYMLPAPMTTTALKVEGNMADGDKEFAVSEIQAFGKPLVGAGVNIDPNTLNLDSKGTWVTCYITLPEGYDAHGIDVETVRLEGLLEVKHSDVQDGVLMVKFDRAEVIAYVEGVLGVTPRADVTLTVTGEMNGALFIGSDTIRVI